MNIKDSPLSFDEQFERLVSKGLFIESREECVHYLQNISYKRLISYSYHYSLEGDADPRKFKEGTRLQHLLNLYRFDRHLRRLVFNAIERIEVSFRSQLINQYSLKYGGKWFVNGELFKNKKQFEEAIFDLKHHINRNRKKGEKVRLEEFTHDMIPVACYTLEQASFGLLSKIFSNAKATDEKKSITEYFNIPFNHPSILENWMHNINIVRNICAHHSKLWDHSNSVPLKIPKEIPLSKQWITIIPSRDEIETEFISRKLYLSICSIYYLLRQANPRTRFSNELMSLFQQFPETPLSAMGFPSEWQKDIFWNQ